MPGKINVYNLGDQGVDLVNTPAHTPDGALVTAQNAIVNVLGAQHGLSKRPGHTKLNTVAAAGAILAICPIPFFDPSNFWIAGTVVFRRIGPNNVEYSTDGTTWQDGGGAFTGSPSNSPLSYLSVAGAGRVYFQTTNKAVNYLSGNPPVETQLAGIAITGQRGIHAVAADEIYVCTNSLIYLCPGNLTSTLICENPWDGDGVPALPFGFEGDVYVASQTTGNSGKIYRYTGGTTWVEDGAFNVDLSVSKFTIFHGELYASLYVSGTPDPAVAKVVRRRSGVWSAVRDATGDFWGLCAFNEQLYVVRDTGAAIEVWISSDGETWTLDEDMTATFGVAAPANAELIAWNSHLYCQIEGDSMFRRTTAGVWSEVSATVPLGVVAGAY